MLDHNFVINTFLKPDRKELLHPYMRFVCTIKLHPDDLDNYVASLQASVDATLQQLNNNADKILNNKDN
jgi:hypothetical protein